MEITWQGLSSLRIKTKNGIVMTDPYGPESGLLIPKLGADVILTHDHFSNTKGFGKAVIINSSGEYEIGGILIEAIPMAHKAGGQVIAYVIRVEDIVLAHLSDIDSIPSENMIEKLQGIDILALPVGGKSVLSGKEASSLIARLEPRIIIPIMYKTSGIKMAIEGPEQFFKEEGVKESPIESFKITKLALPEDESQVVVLKS